MAAELNASGLAPQGGDFEEEPDTLLEMLRALPGDDSTILDLRRKHPESV